MEIQSQIDTLLASTDQVNDSKLFQRALEYILAVGNYMNGSTPRGAAYGFKLDTLVKLHTIKSVDARIHLMHYLARHLQNNETSVVKFASELRHVSTAKRISLRQLQIDIKNYSTELNMLQGQVRACTNEKEKNPDDLFLDIMGPFSTEAAEIMSELKRDLSNLEASYADLVTSFGEDPRKMGTEDFFSTLTNFIDEFQVIFLYNCYVIVINIMGSELIDKIKRKLM